MKNAYHCFISSDHSNPRSFQILGLDILIDENFNAWLMEVNANPSLNVYNDKELPNGDIEQTLSELDKYVRESTSRLDKRIQLLSPNASPIKNPKKVFKINVGGTIFTTRRMTLESASGTFFEGILNGNFPIETDDDGNLFIDRDPKLVRCMDGG